MAQFMCVRKANGKIRLCLDPTHLNKWIIRPRHSSKLMDDILHKLNGAKYFSVVDSTSLFFNHKLDNDSSKLMTFGTPFGMCHYLRMPMGASLMIGTVYRNSLSSTNNNYLSFQIFPRRSCEPQAQERACPTRTYACLAKHYNK